MNAWYTQDQTTSPQKKKDPVQLQATSTTSKKENSLVELPAKDKRRNKGKGGWG